MYVSSNCAAQSVGPANGKYEKMGKKTLLKIVHVTLFDLISIDRIIWNVNSNHTSRPVCNFTT